MSGDGLRPGEILAGILIDRQLGPDRAGALCGLPGDIIESVVHGRLSVNNAIAEGLAKGVGPSAGFWLDAQCRYEEDAAGDPGE